MKTQYTTHVYQTGKPSIIKHYPNKEKSIERHICYPSSKYNSATYHNDNIQLSIQNMKNKIQRYESPTKNRSYNLYQSPKPKQKANKLEGCQKQSPMMHTNQQFNCQNRKVFLRNSSFNSIKNEELAHKIHSGNQINNYFNTSSNPHRNQASTSLKYSQHLENHYSPTANNLLHANLASIKLGRKINQEGPMKTSTQLLMDRLVNRLDCSFEWLKVKQHQKSALDSSNADNSLSKNLSGKTNYLASVKQISNKIDHLEVRHEQRLENHSYNNRCCQVFGFQVGKMLGKGKFGEVFLCKHARVGFLVALKKISKDKLLEYNMVQRISHEIKLHASMDSPNIVKFYGLFEENKHICLAIEYLNGGTLFQYLNKVKRIPLKEAIQFLIDIIQAVCYMHQRSIVHRDIKPENIVLSSQGVAKLCDFGWSAITDKPRKTYCGTFDYAAPEILEKKTYGVQVDIWCIGILAYELLTGGVPFQNEDRRRRADKIIHVDENIIQFPADLPSQAQEFIEALVQKDPSRRPKCDQLLKFKLFQGYCPSFRFRKPS